MLPATARYDEYQPKLLHMTADVASKANERPLKYPKCKRAIEDVGTKIAPAMAPMLSGCGPQAQTKVIGPIRQRTSNLAMNERWSVSPGGDGSTLHTTSADSNPQIPNAAIAWAKWRIRIISTPNAKQSGSRKAVATGAYCYAGLSPRPLLLIAK